MEGRNRSQWCSTFLGYVQHEPKNKQNVTFEEMQHYCDKVNHYVNIGEHQIDSEDT